MKTIYWVIGVAVISIGVFIFLILGDAQKSVPKIKVSYFSNETEIAEAVTKILSQVIEKNSFYWVGVEPEKLEQLEVVYQLQNQLSKVKPFNRVIVDTELRLPKEWLEKFKATDAVSIKETVNATGELLQTLEKNGERYFLITAAIYSTPKIQQNQINQMKSKYLIKPITFSLAYFATTTEEERNMIFGCRTEDHSGASEWGCAVLNKSRFSRRKVNQANEKSWVGLMDLIGEKDYMILLKKK